MLKILTFILLFAFIAPQSYPYQQPTPSPPAALNLKLPQFNFTFPTYKFAQAGQIFQQAQTPILPTAPQASNPSSFANTTFAGFSNSFKAEMAFLIASIK